MKQFKDMNQAERDQFAISRMMQRKDKAEAKGKTYKPRMTGEMPRLIEQYPEQFTWMTGENVIAKTVDQVEVVKVNHSLSSANEFAEYQQSLLLKIGDDNRRMKALLVNGSDDYIRAMEQRHMSEVQRLKRQLKLSEDRAASRLKIINEGYQQKDDLRKEIADLKRELGR